ncbi:MAG: hypothetical protein HQ543_03645 [Bacteroidetes bacterium]|nr:hypothetical protein [Bacteroidota bacterium]
MSILSDLDIKKMLGREIVIEPFVKGLLTPIGYDFTVGGFIFSLEHGLLNTVNGEYEIPSKSTVQILTKESLWVSSMIGGTFHSKVSLVSKGFSHISTTLDPGWYGPLLITIRNNTDGVINMKPGDSFVTLIFSKLETPTKSPHFKPEFRKDILLDQMENQTKDYILKISDILMDENILAEFEKKVRSANRKMFTKVSSSVRSIRWLRIIIALVNLSIYALIAGLLSLQFYWEKVKPIFHNINYDSKIFALQVMAVIALVSLRLSLRKK